MLLSKLVVLIDRYYQEGVIFLWLVSIQCTLHITVKYTHNTVLIHSLLRFSTGSVPASPTSAFFFRQFFLSSLLTCDLSSFLPQRTYVQGITIPPPCTHTPSSAALVDQSGNFTRHGQYFSGGKERKQHSRYTNVTSGAIFIWIVTIGS